MLATYSLSLTTRPIAVATTSVILFDQHDEIVMDCRLYAKVVLLGPQGESFYHYNTCVCALNKRTCIASMFCCLSLHATS